MNPAVQRFCSALVGRRLLSRDEVKDQFKAWRTANPADADSLSSFVRYLAGQGRLTEQQLVKLIDPPQKVTALVAQVPAAVPLALPVEEYDVELVVVPPTGLLDRRHWLMLAAGGLGGFVVGLIAGLLFHSRTNTPNPE